MDELRFDGEIGTFAVDAGENSLMILKAAGAHCFQLQLGQANLLMRANDSGFTDAAAEARHRTTAGIRGGGAWWRSGLARSAAGHADRVAAPAG